MMEFKGVYTALVTPFVNGGVDWKALRELVEMQVKGRVAGIVPVGTTGESPTLSCEEHLKVIEAVVETAAGRCTIIAVPARTPPRRRSISLARRRRSAPTRRFR